jgi:hypothetical protein
MGKYQDCVLGSVLLNIFIRDLDQDIKDLLIKFASGTKLGRMANGLESRADFQKILTNGTKSQNQQKKIS